MYLFNSTSLHSNEKLFNYSTVKTLSGKFLYDSGEGNQFICFVLYFTD